MRRSSDARPSSLLEKSSSKSKLKSQIELGKIPQERMMSSPPQIQVANLDHLGLVAGMIDGIGIVEKINDLVGTQPGEKVSPGQAVKAMILNGLGLVSAPLYLFSKFFEGKATEHLIGAGIQPEHLGG